MVALLLSFMSLHERIGMYLEAFGGIDKLLAGSTYSLLFQQKRSGSPYQLIPTRIIDGYFLS